MVYGGIINQTPGVGALYETVEKIVGWGPSTYFNYFRMSGVIDGASRDDSHTDNTTLLRPGLLMAYNQTTQRWMPYDSALGATVGGTIGSIFLRPESMQLHNADVDRFGGYLLRPGAPIKWKALLTNDGTAGTVSGHASKAAIRTALEGLGYVLDDYYAPEA